MRNAGLDEAPSWNLKIAGRNINNLRYADETTLMAESEEELKSLLMKDESKKVGLKLNIQKTKIMAAAAPAKSLQWCPTLCNPIDGCPPGSSIPGILQGRILERVAISFSNACTHAKLLQSCPTLCDPMDSSPLGSSVHRILQARILEWVAISFSNACTHAKPLQLCPTVRSHGQQPTRLLCPRDSLGKNTGVSCHFLLRRV